MEKRNLLSFTSLSEFGKSANHLLTYWSGDKIQTSAMLEGKLTHKLILEEDKVEESFVIYKDRRQGGKWEEFKEKHKDKDIVNEKEYYSCVNLSESAKKDPLFSEMLLKATQVEKHVAWEREGVKFHGYIDGIGEEESFYFDVKTCQDSGEKFQRDLRYNDMPMQAAMYLDWAGDLTKPFYFVAIEKKAPFNVQVYQVGQDLIQKGYNKYTRLIKEYKEWDGSPRSYSDKIITVNLNNNG